MRGMWGWFVMAALCLSACVFDTGPGFGGSEKWGGVTPGFYYKQYSVEGQNFESEMVLDSSGRFRFIDVSDSTPRGVTRGTWEVRNGAMIWKSLEASYPHSEFNFDHWHAFSEGDTSFLREISPEGFQRLESYFDPERFGIFQWFTYHRVNPLPTLSGGRYEYSETYRDWADTNRIVSALNFLELTPGGEYRDGRIVDGMPSFEFKSDRWLQAGSFLITQGDSSRQYNDSAQSFSRWVGYPTEEYVVRLRNISADSFQQWLPYGLTFQPEAYWVTWRRVTEPAPTSIPALKAPGSLETMALSQHTRQKHRD